MKTKNSVLGSILCLGISVLVSGCSGFFLGDENLSEAVDLPKNPQIVAFNTAWERNVGDGTDGKALHLRPSVVGDRVFAVSADGILEALELNSGNRIWRQKIGHQIASGVSADQYLAVVGTRDGLILAFDANTGEAGWTYQMNTEVLTPATVANGLVIARAIDGQVTALDARSGEVIWKQYIGVADLSIRGNARGILLRDVILFTNGKGRLNILRVADGSPVLSTPLVMGKGMTEVERIADLLATPTVSNGILFVSAYRHKTLAINLKDGSLLWESPYATAADLFADNNYLYLVDKNSLIHALDIRDGRLRWTKKTLEGRHISPLTGNGRWIAGVDNDGYLSVLDNRGGKYLGHTRVGDGRTYVAPQLVEGGLLTYTSDGDLAFTTMQAREQ